MRLFRLFRVAVSLLRVPSVHHCDLLLILKLQTKINPMQLQCKPSSTVMLCNRTQGKSFSMVQLV